MYRLAKHITGSKDELPGIGVAHRLVGNTEGESGICIVIVNFNIYAGYGRYIIR